MNPAAVGAKRVYTCLTQQAAQCCVRGILPLLHAQLAAGTCLLVLEGACIPARHEARRAPRGPLLRQRILRNVSVLALEGVSPLLPGTASGWHVPTSAAGCPHPRSP